MERFRWWCYMLVAIVVVGCGDDTKRIPVILEETTTPDPQAATIPAQVVFTRNDTVSGVRSIWGMQTNGTGQFQLAPKGDSFVWAPDGKRICVLQRGRDNAEMFLITPDGLEREDLGIADWPSWFADGSKLAYSRERTLYVLDLNIREEKAVGPWGFPIWSSDGEVSQILETENPGMDHRLIYMFDVRSNERRLLIDGAGWLNSSNLSPLSPDGNELLVTPCGDGVWCIGVMGLRDLSVRRLALWGLYAAWSPDGSKIAFSTRSAFGVPVPGLFVAAADGGQEIRLAEDLQNPQFPSWTPDGESVIFSAHDSAGIEWIYTISVDGTNLTKLAQGSRPKWSPG